MLTFLNREGQRVPFNIEKIYNAIYYAINDTGVLPSIDHDAVISHVESRIKEYIESTKSNVIPTAVADSIAFNYLANTNKSAAQKYIECSERKKRNYELVKENEEFLRRYTNSNNNANATVDDNSNVNTKTVANLNSEIYKESNIIKNRGMIINKLKELNKRGDAHWMPIDPKQYKRDLESHIIYKNDESSSNSGATMPYCVSISMYPFVLNGLKDLGYGNADGAPKHLLSYCSMFNNLVFNIASQFAGAVATSEFLIFFDYYARKDFGDKWYNNRTNLDFVEQMFQMVVHTINQPAGGRGMQACFWNISIFDKYYFDAMFSEMIYPDFETKPCWESISRLQKFFLMWFLEERKKTPLTFPVISYSMLTEDGKYKDEETFDFLCDQLSKGDDSFIYNSNSADSLASCCRLRNEVDTKEFNFTNGNIGIMTGSKSVITINLNRLAQLSNSGEFFLNLSTLCDRIAHYHVAYNELIWDSINNGLLPVYTAGFIDADKQFLTIGLNGLNEAAEWFGYDISNNAEYLSFVDEIGKTIDGCNKRNSGTYFGHKIKLNCEFVPAESLGVKNCNWDKADGFEVPYDRVLYSSYVFQPFKPNTVLDRIAMHGSKSLGTMGGGSACHINIAKPFTKDQYKGFLEYAAKVGCSYLTFNLINTIFECGHTSFTDEDTCPICGAKAKDKSMPIIGYRTAISQWSSARQQFFKSWILATE